MSREEPKEAWYYDACTLESAQIYAEIINKKNPHRSLVSHLAIGEAYGNSLSDPEKAEALVDLINKLDGYITIIGNDAPNRVFNLVREICPNLDVTDALHLATALNNGCCVLRTMDRDLYGLNKANSSALAKECGIESFAITNTHT